MEQARFGLLAMRNICHGAGHAQRSSEFIPHGYAATRDPADFAALGGHPVFALEVSSATFKVLIHSFVKAFAISLIDTFEPFPGLVGNLALPIT